MAVSLKILSTYRLVPDYRNPATDTTKEAKYSPVFSTTKRTTASGTAASQANRFYDYKGTIAASGTLTRNVATAGALVDVFGNTLNLSRVCEVIVEHLPNSAATGTITVGGGSNPLFATLSQVLGKEGGLYHFRNYNTAGLAVTTNVNLLITNNDSSNAATVRVIIVGSQ